MRWKPLNLFEYFDSFSLKGNLRLELYEEHLVHPKVVGELEASVDGYVVTALTPPATLAWRAP